MPLSLPKLPTPAREKPPRRKVREVPRGPRAARAEPDRRRGGRGAGAAVFPAAAVAGAAGPATYPQG